MSTEQIARPTHSEQLDALASAVSAVMGQIGYVQKAQQMTHGQRYNYAGEADFLRAIRPHMIDAGLSLIPSGCEVVSSEERPTNRGGVMNAVRIVASYMLLHTSGQWMTVQVSGEGADSGDKAIPKALTGALKYAWRQTFGIETGNDPDDHRPEADEGRPPTPEPPPPPPALSDPGGELAEATELQAACQYAVRHMGWERGQVMDSLRAVGAVPDNPKAEQIEDPVIRGDLFRVLTTMPPDRGLAKVTGQA